MVSFSCDHCQEIIKKPKLKHHHCSHTQSFSCIDCSKTFSANEYQTHTSCISEFQKYHAKDTKLSKQNAALPSALSSLTSTSPEALPSKTQTSKSNNLIADLKTIQSSKPNDTLNPLKMHLKKCIKSVIRKKSPTSIGNLKHLIQKKYAKKMKNSNNVTALLDDFIQLTKIDDKLCITIE